MGKRVGKMHLRWPMGQGSHITMCISLAWCYLISRFVNDSEANFARLLPPQSSGDIVPFFVPTHNIKVIVISFLKDFLVIKTFNHLSPDPPTKSIRSSPGAHPIPSSCLLSPIELDLCGKFHMWPIFAACMLLSRTKSRRLTPFESPTSTLHRRTRFRKCGKHIQRDCRISVPQ